MGNSKSSNSTYYDPTLNAELVDENKQYKIYRNKNGEQFEKYEVKAKGSSDFENRYEYRIRNSSPYLVDAYSAKSSHNAFGCASGEKYEVVTERIPVRLNDLNNLSGGEAINMVNRALKGFQQIYKSQGVLLVKDSMIGVNKQNEIKVWMNSNFAVNEVQQPPISYGVLSDQEKESTMVDNIVELINSRARKDPQWVSFVQEKYRQGSIGFDQAIRISQAQAHHFNIPIFDHTNSAVHHQNIQQTQHKDNHYQSYQIPQQQPQQNTQFSNTTQYHNTAHEQPPSVLKNTTQTVTSSVVNPMNVIAAHSSFAPDQPINTNINVSMNAPANSASMKVGQSQGFSTVKNRIINGHTSNKVQTNLPFQGNIAPKVSSSFPNFAPPPPPQNIQKNNLPMNFLQPAPITTLLPPQNITQTQTQAQVIRQTPPPPPQIINQQPPRAIANFSNPIPYQQNRPRAQSEGKPMVTFGSKVVQSAGSNSFAANINPIAPPTFVGVQTPQFQSQPQMPPKFSDVPQANPIIQQQRLQPVQQSNPIKITSQPQQPQVNNVGGNFQKIGERIQENQVVYPPPNQVVNFERRVQAAQIKSQQIQPITKQGQVSQTQFAVGQEIKIKPQQILQENIQKSQYVVQIASVPQKSKVQIVNASNNGQNNLNPSSQISQTVTKSEAFGVTTSVQSSKIGQGANQKFQTAQKQQVNKNKNMDTPVFGRQKNINVQQELYKTNIVTENHLDHYLALEEQQLQKLKESQSQNTVVLTKEVTQTQAQSSINKEQNITKQKQQIKASPPPSEKLNQPVVIEQNKSLVGSKKEQRKKQTMKDENNFRKAVQQTASNIRMEASKISIRSSSDLKGIISYKDLRDLLKTTRKPAN